ncbi:ABC transporter permease [Govanella unica]|uniref:ABC transporter permease n=1 Tax=Govanella unica TaxID=2975056 RepID=A0A9X3Z874_9PROT|nr:ABC transporter permease [Govania unica]MDA5194851.1 ABC transporter permease [Govania unica]
MTPWGRIVGFFRTKRPLTGWGISRHGFVAMFTKEFVQMRRDRMTVAMMLGMPLIQLFLFGFAINTDPRNLPAVLVASDNGPVVRSIVTALENTGYYRFTRHTSSPDVADQLVQAGEVQFAFIFPEDFERRYMRGDRPKVLIEADATDPTAIGSALAAAAGIDSFNLGSSTEGSLAMRAPQPRAYDFVVQRRYNPENKTRYNIVPGLVGVILSMTMLIITSIAVTRERERGTLETLLVMPFSPLEVMFGKITPYVFVGYVQLAFILTVSYFIFGVPLQGSLLLLSLLTIIFIAANLALGFLFSTAATTQLEAVQMTFFAFLPSILLSGFMFPFRGMPEWAQWIGSVLPMTHYIRIVRGIVLKGSSFMELWDSIWPLTLIFLAISAAALIRYRRTLD